MSTELPFAPGPGASDPISDHVELLAVMSRDFADSRDIEQTLRRGLSRITDYLEAEGGALFLLDEGGETLTCSACVGASSIEGLNLSSAQGIVGRCVRLNRGELVRDASADPAFFGGFDEQTGFTTRSIVCAPMSVRDVCIGAIELVNKRGEDPRFTAGDLHVLEAMASSAALAILNAHMAEALVEQERVRRELELAAEIQRSLLPPEHAAEFPVHGVNLPAFAVSGDFYDFFQLRDGRICFNLGDVSGKGMNAALLMAKTSSLYRALGKTILSPGRLLARINAEICETATRGMFVTLVGGIYDPATGEVRLFNAGHEPPLVFEADGSVHDLPAAGIPLGIFADRDEDPADETVLHLNGRSLYIFSDGVTEGFLNDGSVLTVDGLKRLLCNLADRPAAERLEGVTAMFRRSGQPLRDDVTLLVIDDAGPAAHRTRASIRPDSPAADTEEVLRLTVPARADRLRLVRSALTAMATEVGCCDAVARDLVLAVDEACQNVIRHAYGDDPSGRIIVIVRREGDNLVVLLRDFAEPVDVEKIRPRDLGDVRPGGLGTHLMREVLDEVAFLPTPADGGNLLRMVKRIT